MPALHVDAIQPAGAEIVGPHDLVLAVDAHDLAVVALEEPDIVVRVEAEHGPAHRPARELARLGIVFHGPVVHADDDVALGIELQLMRAAAGIARASVHLSAIAAPRSL